MKDILDQDSSAATCAELKQPNHRYWHAGLPLVSELPLPELDGALKVGASQPHCVPPVIIRCAAVPHPVVPHEPRIAWHVEGEHVWIRADGVGYFLVRGGREILADVVATSSAVKVRTWLLGTVFSALALQRGLIPLHVASFWTPAGILAISGRSGDGKSTLAAALLTHGAQLLADDVAYIEPGSLSRGKAHKQQILTYPGVPRLRLSEPAITQLGLENQPWRSLGDDRIRHETPLPLAGTAAVTQAGYPLAALVFLDRTESAVAPACLERLPRIHAVGAARSALYRPRLAETLLGADVCNSVYYSLSVGVPFYRLSRPMGFHCLQVGINAIASLFADLGAPLNPVARYSGSDRMPASETASLGG